MTVEQYIKDNIQAKGLKISYLAQTLGISLSKLSSSLNGRRELRALEFISLCMVMNLDLKDFKNLDQ